MVAATEMGAVIAPPLPAFYTNPKSLDDIVNHSVGRALVIWTRIRCHVAGTESYVSDTPSPYGPLIWLVFLVIVIDLVGFGLVIPLLPFMAPSLGGDSTDVAFIMITYALGAP